MPMLEYLKSAKGKADNFCKKIHYGSETLEKKILEGKVKYLLELVPGPGDYLWSRSMGHDRGESVGGAAFALFVRGVPIAASIATGNPSWAIASEGFFDAVHEITTAGHYRLIKLNTVKENHVNF